MTNYDLIDRYLAGECTPDEAARVRATAEADPRLRELLSTLPPATRGDGAGSWNVDAAWAALNRPKAVARRKPFPWMRVAAVLVVGAALGVIGRGFDQPRTQEQSVASQSYSAPAGAPREVTLADGSIVTIAPHSTLTVPVTFPGSGRDVYLDGEAFFQVTHDAAKPYIVHAHDSQTRVLGTTFNVSAYANAPIEVVVATGRVQLSSPESRAQHVLIPGQLGRLDAGAISVETVDVDAYTSWRQGLTFRAMRFDAALPRLERWFGVDIEIADANLASQRLTAFFDHQALEDVLDALAATLNARYERTGTRIVFHSN
jgi:ferric-dicitrate binding protein FerR (iron transport regulator)